MVDFQTLNLCEIKKDFTSNQREDDIEHLLSEYQTIISLLLNGNENEARNLICRLLDSPYLNEELEVVKDVHDSNIHVLQFCVFKLASDLLSEFRLEYLEKVINIKRRML